MSESKPAENESLSMTIGAAAKRARKRIGITQEKASELMGISTEFYARMERGKALPSVETFEKMVEVLQVDADVLLGLAPGPGEVRQSAASGLLDVQPPRDSPQLRRLIRQLRKADTEVVEAIEDVLNRLEELGERRRQARAASDTVPLDVAPAGLDGRSGNNHGSGASASAGMVSSASAGIGPGQALSRHPIVPRGGNGAPSRPAKTTPEQPQDD